MSLASWMSQVVTIASESGRDQYGKPTYATQRTITARVQQARRVVKNGRGEESVATHTIFTLEPVLATDRLWLPGANTTTQAESFLPLAVDASSDKAGARTLYRVDIGA